MRGHEPRVQPPALDAYSDLPLFNTKAVVHQTGVPAPTLRAWERRYGVLSPRRGENDYRLYSERDIITVAWLRERVQTGMTISQAIALLKSLEPVRRRARRYARTAAGARQGGAHGDVAGPSVATLGRFSLAELRATLLHHLAALDEVAANRTIAQTMAVYPLEEVCLELLVPVMAEIGRLWADGTVSIAVEHFASGVVRAQLESLFRSASGSASGPLALVGCAPGELHELGALMLALFLRRSGLRVVYLGQNVESESLLETVRVVHPATILLSLSLHTQVDPLVAIGHQLAALSNPRPLFGFGGHAFTCEPELASQIPGHFLGTNAQEAVRDVKQRLSV